MAQPSQDPLFGEWERNVQYTTYFGNIRKGKEQTSWLSNPHDPEQNPSAFIIGQRKLGKAKKPNQTVNTYNNGNINVAQQMHHQSRLQEGNIPELRSDRSYFDHSNCKSNHLKKSGRASLEDSYNYPSSPQPNQAAKATNTHQTRLKQIHRPASVPLFGVWDQTPQSSDGFTIIFNRIKEQRQRTGTALQTVHEGPVSHEQGMEDSEGSPKDKVPRWGCSIL